MSYIEFGLAHPGEYELVFSIRRFTSAWKPKLLRKSGEISNRAGGLDAFLSILGCVKAGLKAGVLQGARSTIALVLWAAIHGCVSLLLTQEGMALGSSKTFAPLTVSALLKGVSNYRRQPLTVSDSV